MSRSNSRRPSRHLLQAHETRTPAVLVAAAAVLVGKALLREHHARAAGRRIERDGDFGLVAAHPGIVVPAPGEHEALWRLDRAVDAAHGVVLAVGRTHGGAPAPAGP